MRKYWKKGFWLSSRGALAESDPATGAVKSATSFGRCATNVLFLMLVSCFLLGCNRSHQENTDIKYTRKGSRDYVGSNACVACHREQYEEWRGSHHDLATQHATKDSVLGNFEDTKLQQSNMMMRLFRSDKQYWVEVDNAVGIRETFKVEYTLGVYPLQQYLVALPGGRYQALTAAWDSRPKTEGGQRWFDLQPDTSARPGQPLHWTGQYYNWNSRCAECHSTGLRKNYDATRNAYRTTWASLSVACEACHGPGSDHLKWAAGQTRVKGVKAGLDDFDLDRSGPWIRKPQEATAQLAAVMGKAISMSRQLDVCGPCHSRRKAIGEPNLEKSPKFHDNYVLSLPTPTAYYADGQIRDEDYELGSFLQSKMYTRGVQCSNCHNPHSLRLKGPGNAVCSQCHNPTVFDRSIHHHHKVNSPGALCANCHMPVRTYMAIDQRRDHSLRVPRPDLSIRFGTPNACNQCHQERGNAWATDQVDQWRRTGDKSLRPHFSDQLASSNSSLWMQLAADKSAPPIARASALSFLARRPTPNVLAETKSQLRDPDPVVRGAAVEVYESAGVTQRLDGLAPLVNDPTRSVRMQVAALLAGVDMGALSDAQHAALWTLFDEFTSSMREAGDIPSNCVTLGLFYADRGETELAYDAYRRALNIDIYFVPAYLNLADLYRQQGNEDAARNTLNQALRLAPADAAAQNAMGLQRARAHAYGEALQHLERAHELAPDDLGYAYVYAIALFDAGFPDRSIDLLKDISSVDPEDERVLMTLEDFLGRRGRYREAITLGESLLARHPDDRRLRQWLSQIRVKAETK